MVIALTIIYQVLKLAQGQNILIILSISLLFQSFIPFNHRSLTSFSLIFLIVLSLFGLMIFVSKREIKDKYFKTLGYVLLATFFIRTIQTIQLYSSVEPQNRPQQSLDKNIKSLELNKSPSILPNVYHIIFDHLPSRPIPDFLKEENKINQGLTNFPNAITDYVSTQHSIQSVYLGRKKRKDETIMEFLAFGESEEHHTLLKQFKSHGYKIIMNNIFSNHKFKSKIDSFYYYDNFYDDLFRKFVYQYQYLYWKFMWTLFPVNFSIEDVGIFVGSDPLSIIKEIKFHKSLLNAFKDPKFKQTGQAFFLYIKTPHPPYIQDSECNTTYPFVTYYSKDASRVCGHKLIAETINTIKQVHKKSSYYLAIHSDHGDSENKGFPFLLTNFHNEGDSFITNYSPVKIRHILKSILYRIENKTEDDVYFPHNDKYLKQKEPLIYKDLSTMEAMEIIPEDLKNEYW